MGVNDKYREIAKAKIREDRFVVISEYMNGGYTLAQCVTVFEQGKTPTTIFLKEAIHVEALEGLKELRDALNLTIADIEENK